MNPNWHFPAPVVGPYPGYPVQDFVPEGPDYPDMYASEGYHPYEHLSETVEVRYQEVLNAYCNAAPLVEPAHETPTTNEPVIDPALLDQDAFLEELGNKDWTNSALTIPWQGGSEVQDAQPQPGHVHVEATVDVTSVTATLTYTEDVVTTAKDEIHTPTPVAPAPADSPSTNDSVKSESVQTEDQVVLDPSKLNMDDIKMMASSGVGSHTRFKNVEEARQSLVREGQGQDDPTLPTTDEQKRVMVLLLFRAARSTNKANKDSAKTISRFTGVTFTDGQIEAKCWEIMDRMIRLHTEGLPEGHKKEIGLFLDRFKNVLDSLERSKSICKHLMDPDFVDTFVEDPIAALKRVMSNKRVNENKSRIIKAGTKAMAESKAAEEQQAADQDQAGHDDDGPTPNPQMATPASTTGAGKKRARKTDGKGAGSSKKARRA